MYENEIIDFQTLLKGMVYKKTSSQYSFHTEKSIRLLRKVEDWVEFTTAVNGVYHSGHYWNAYCPAGNGIWWSKFYNSEVFEKLQDEETGLYKESSAYVYDLFKDEMNFGHIIQAEI
mgnify:CR=1 FL=1